jgi:lysophospholipase
LRGELREPRARFSFQNNDFVNAVAASMRATTLEEKDDIGRALLPTLLCTYATKDDAVSLEQLLSSGASANIADYSGRTPMHLACSNGCLRAVEALLGYGADVGATDHTGHSPIYYACRGNHVQIVRCLARLSARLTFESDTEGCAIFCRLVREAAADKLETWALGGADFNVQDCAGVTPLHIAADEGNLVIARLLIQHGATPKKDRWGLLPDLPSLEGFSGNADDEAAAPDASFCSTASGDGGAGGDGSVARSPVQEKTQKFWDRVAEVNSTTPPPK